MDEILGGISETSFPKENLHPVVDRKEALQMAVGLAKAGDLILVAGKGHEDYQIVGKTKSHFSDQEILRELLKGPK
jgi:UDP-N-acetylmuramoyl-L-alanyl-D-glutamate--2,6-diaminopimelate ligase